MATFLINTAGVSQPGTPADDFFFVESGAFGASLQGLGANDSFDFTNFTTGSTYGNGSANGNLGNDTFDILVNSGSNLIGSFFGGGQGNDRLDIDFDNADKIVANLFQGGEGNDTIIFSAASADSLTNNTINGNGGSDLISISAAGSSSITNLFVGGGQGDDVVNVHLSSDTSNAINGVIVNGGLGVDIINIGIGHSTAVGLNVNGGTFGTQESTDVSDNIFVSAQNLIQATIAGNSGNDAIVLQIDDGTSTQILINGNAGNDTLEISGDTVFARSTIGGGQGDDLIQVESAAQFSGGGNSLVGGLGADTFFFDLGYANSASNGFTIQGGAGADLVVASGAFASGANSSQTIGGGFLSYASLSDSTFAARDTIVVGTANSGTFNLTLPSSVDVVSNGQIGSTNLFASAGILQQTGASTANNLTLGQMVSLLDSNLAEGDAVGFRLTTSSTAGASGYVFVKGAADDLLVEFSHLQDGSFSANSASLTNAGNNSVDLKIFGDN